MNVRFSKVTIGMVSLALVAVLLVAGCTSTPSEDVAAVKVTKITITVDPAVTLGLMHADMMEAIEEALAYPVLNNPEEKSDFEANVADFDKLAKQFEIEAGLDKPENAETKAAYDAILVKKAALVTAAEKFFASYEADGAVNTDDLVAFEESVDDFTSAFGPFTKSYFDSVSESEFGDDGHARAALDLLSMHRDLLEGVEEAFGYVLLGETVEKDDFSQMMQAFDDAGNDFVETGYLDQSGNEAALEAYTTMMEAKEQMQTAASAMFAEYEDTGAVSEDTANAFEVEVDKTTTAFDALLEEVLKEL